MRKLILKLRALLVFLVLLPARLLYRLEILPGLLRFLGHVAYLLAGGEELRYQNPLGPKSLVLDLGGYKGHFALELLKRYECRIWIFEALPEYAARLRRRLGRIPGLRVFPFGLAGLDQSALLSVDEDSSSVFGTGKHVKVKLRNAGAFLNRARPKHIDFMKINIEGGEYELLERLLPTQWPGRIQRLQVQFHAFVPGALGRHKAIQAQLSRSHRLEWEFPLVWESWVLKGGRHGHH